MPLEFEVLTKSVLQFTQLELFLLGFGASPAASLGPPPQFLQRRRPQHQLRRLRWEPNFDQKSADRHGACGCEANALLLASLGGQSQLSSASCEVEVEMSWNIMCIIHTVYIIIYKIYTLTYTVSVEYLNVISPSCQSESGWWLCPNLPPFMSCHQIVGKTLHTRSGHAQWSREIWVSPATSLRSITGSPSVSHVKEPGAKIT